MKRDLSRISVLVVIAVFVPVTSGCRQSGDRVVHAAVEADETNPDLSGREALRLPVTRPTYDRVLVNGPTTLSALRAQLGVTRMDAVLRVNRIDVRHIKKGSILMIPETVDLGDLSPFPKQVPAAREIPKLILVSRRVQSFGAYESGTLVRWGPVSTGKKSTPTPSGLYHTNWKSKKTVSTVDASWILPWYFNLDNFEGVGFHQYALPGYPASHACIRLLEEDAKWIYGWADQWILSADMTAVVAYGSPVIVFGDYPYNESPPWQRLDTDPDAGSVDLQEIERVLGGHLALIEERDRSRRELLLAEAAASFAPPE